MIICVSAKAGHGKDSYYAYLKQRIMSYQNTNCQRFRYSDVLKQMCDSLFQRLKPFFKTEYQFQAVDDQLKKSPQGMQFARTWWLAVGRYAKKYFGDRIWADAIFNSQFIQKYAYPANRYKNFAVITDLRFKNQMPIGIDKAAIKMVRLWRPGPHPTAGHLGTSQSLAMDRSETDLDDLRSWDRHVLNDRGMQKIKQDAYRFIKQIMQER